MTAFKFELPQYIQNKNAAISHVAVEQLKTDIKSIGFMDLMNVVGGDSSQLLNKIEPTIKVTADEAIKEYLPVLVGAGVVLLAGGFMLGYYIKKKDWL